MTGFGMHYPKADIEMLEDGGELEDSYKITIIELQKYLFRSKKIRIQIGTKHKQNKKLF